LSGFALSEDSAFGVGQIRKRLSEIPRRLAPLGMTGRGASGQLTGFQT
jgi:hypothetical protein